MLKQKPLRLVFSGGGSGGHILPSIAIASTLQKTHDIESLFIISASPQDADIVRSAGYNYYVLHTGKLRRYLSFENIIDVFRTIRSFFSCFFLLFRYRPHVIFSKGGFVSVPVAFAGYFLRIPIIAHESDSVLGLSNAMIAPLSRVVCTTFPLHIPRERRVGIPLRASIHQANPQRGRELIGAQVNQKIVLFFGASQGSEQINDLAFSLRSRFSEDVFFVVLAGKSIHYTSTEGIKVFGFIQDDIFSLLSCADIIITRAGATSLFELACLSKCCIAIPHRATGGDHQRKNAQYFVDNKALSVLDPDDPHLEDSLFSLIQSLLDSPEQRLDMEKNIHTLSCVNAESIIADLLLEYLKT